MRGCSTGDFASAASRCFAIDPSATPTGMRSGGFSRNAKPRAIVRRIGKAKTQKIASGSRMNSFIREIVSSMSGGGTFGSGIAELPSGHGHEENLGPRGLRRARDQLRAVRGDAREELRPRGYERVDAKLPPAGARGGAVASVDVREGIAFEGRLARELDDVRRLEPGDQLRGRAEGDEVAVIDDRHAVAETLRLF